jgi:thioredoxin reductase (NADPH)
VLVSLQFCHEIIELDANTYSGSGCIAALEAEKFLAEQEAEVENKLEQEKQAEKGSNVVVPEYRSNPLL